MLRPQFIVKCVEVATIICFTTGDFVATKLA